MTISDYDRWKHRLFHILESKEPTRTNRLVNFMADLARACDIPAKPTIAFEKKYPAIMSLYWTADSERNF